MVLQQRYRTRRDQGLRAHNGIFSIYAVVGGGGTGILPYLQKRQPNFTLLVDVAHELEAISPDFHRLLHRQALDLADRDTTNTLLSEVYDPSRPIYGLIGSATGTDGMGQRRALGQIAASKLTQTPRFADVCARLRDEVLVQCSGAPECIELTVVGSVCGGTAAGAAEHIASELAHALEALDIPISVRFQLVDSVSFATLGPNIHTNAAASTNSLLDLVVGKGGNPGSKICWSLRLTSLPPVRNDKAARDLFFALDHQAWQCQALQNHLQIVDPNEALRNQYGNVKLVSCDFFHTIPGHLVAATVASHYHYDFRTVLESIVPSKDVVDRFLEHGSAIPLLRKEVKPIVDSVGETLSGDMVHALRAPGEEWAFSPAAVLTAGEEYSLVDIDDHFVAVPQSLAVARQQLVLLESIDVELADVIANLNHEIAEFEARIELQEKRCVRVFDKLRRKSLRNLHPQLREQALEEAQFLRDLSDDLGMRTAVLSAFHGCRERVAVEIQSQRQRLDGVLTLLDRHRLKGQRADSQRLFYIRDVNSAFADLLSLRELDFERQRKLLAAQAGQVTGDGMAYIAGTTSTNVESIAQNLTGEAPVPGAFVGAARPASEEVIYVLPPVADALAAELKRCILAVAPTALVFVGDSCTSGLNVVRFKLSRPKSRQEALPGFLQAELEKSKTPPFSDLYAVDRQRSA